MKKFIKGFFGMLWRHKLLSIICFLAFIIVIIMSYLFFNMFIGSSGKYGDRLKGIEKVEISKKDKKEVESFLEENPEVTEANVRIQGKIIYIHIVYTRETTLDKAKIIATSALEKFNEDEKKFYDIGFSLTQIKQEGTEDIGFVVTGSKNANLENISWIKS